MLSLVSLDKKLSSGEVESNLLGSLGNLHPILEDLTKERALILE